MAPITYLTGANEAYFAMACGLSFSFQAYCPGETLYICDFGLSQHQRRFLREQGVLLELPTELGSNPHPWLCKASLKHFLQPLDVDAVAWIDSDCVVLSSLPSALETLLNQAGDREFLAVGADVASPTIQAFLDKNNAEPFAAGLQKRKIDTSQSYLNSGVFLLRSQDFLSQWATLTREVENHAVFEQNMFNLLAYSLSMDLQALDPRVWNVHDHHLASVQTQELPDGSVGFFSDDERVRVVHATASQPGHTQNCNLSFSMEGKTFEAYCKLLTNPCLQQAQHAAIGGYVNIHAESLLKHGLFE